MELDKLKITNIGEAERKLLLQAIGFKLNKKGEFDNFQCYYCGEKIDYRTCGIMPPLKRGEFGRMTCSSPLCIAEYLTDYEESNPSTQANPTDLSHNNNFTAHSDSPKVCPNCKEEIQIYINDECEEEERCYCSQ